MTLTLRHRSTARGRPAQGDADAVPGLTGLDHAARAAALARRTRAQAGPAQTLQTVDTTHLRADPRLVRTLGEHLCLARRMLPLRYLAGTLVLLVDPAGAETPPDVSDLPGFKACTIRLVPCPPDQMDAQLALACPTALQDMAERRTPLHESCRGWRVCRARGIGAIGLLAALGGLMTWPATSFALLLGWGVLTLVIMIALKLVATVLFLRRPPETPPPRPLAMRDLPTVSVLVPLFKERDIATALIARLRRLDYPDQKLDICLVVERDDRLTRATVAHADLPRHMRVIEVPPGTLQTKPRALNYALNFARGTIVGVLDAEDAPDPAQIRMVVNRFAARDGRVACLQGRLDYYNSRANWLARCFTIEYATWFRIVLPGIQKLGLAVPLGGTTLFFRREILESLGGWDAHNVTEDADLGIRLARHGYRTEILETVTEEEANARAWPWVKQRSRWLKGYALTWAVHMRRPRQLWRDLGPRAFLGVQLLFLGTLSQFVLMPALWSLWLIALGLPHPLSGVVAGPVALALALLFIGAEVIGAGISALAVRDAGKPDLMKWAPTLHVYFPLAALAAYKGLLELASRPFYWDKTAHGIFAPGPRRPTAQRTLMASRLRPRHPAAAE
ncbi:glycosyltransferase [Salibaculum halophilum]|uniref:glycosyltransferase n=1 Tax=Salibaculum halophilum TaxID=1914408 RepID=UPI000A117B2B|nr:glycosyltransferase [Salibaculum halophilum]